MSITIVRVTLLVPLFMAAMLIGCRTTTPEARMRCLMAARQELRMLDIIEGHWVGPPPPERGRFYLLSEQFLRCGSAADYRDMLEDTNAIVRVMGLACLASTDKRGFPELAQHHADDRGEVLLITGGCVAQRMTVGSIAQNIQTNRYFLGWILYAN